LAFWLWLFGLIIYFKVVPVGYLKPLKFIVKWWVILLIIAFFPYALLLRLMGERLGEEVAQLAVGGLGIIAAYLAAAFVFALCVKVISGLKRLVHKAESK